MPIENIERGRGYTKRSYRRVVGSLTGPESEVMARTYRAAVRGASLEGKLNDAIRAAEAQLDRSGLPRDVTSSVYSDDWMREKEKRASLDWYAVKILRSVLFCLDFYKRGDNEAAIAEGITIGGLMAEAAQVDERVAGQVRGGEGAKTSDKRLDQGQERERWLKEARRHRERRPLLKARAVARLIAPARIESCRKIIIGLWDKK